MDISCGSTIINNTIVKNLKAKKDIITVGNYILQNKLTHRKITEKFKSQFKPEQQNLRFKIFHQQQQ